MTHLRTWQRDLEMWGAKVESGSQRQSRLQRGHEPLFTDGHWVEAGHQGRHCSHPGLVLENAKLVLRAFKEDPLKRGGLTW